MELQHSATEFRSIFDVMKDLVTDVNMIFSAEGVSIMALDPEKVVAVSLHLTTLQKYEFTNDDPLTIGVNMQHIYKTIRGSGPHHIIKMSISPDTPNVLKIILENLSNGVLSTTSLYSLQLSKEQPILPEYTFEAVARIPTSDFLRSVKDLSHGSKKITISATNEDAKHLVLASKGANYLYTTLIAICPSENGLEWIYFNQENIHGQYIVKYIEKFGKPQLGKTLELGFTSEGVLGISYYNLSLGQMSITVAPLLQQ